MRFTISGLHYRAGLTKWTPSCEKVVGKTRQKIVSKGRKKIYKSLGL